MLWTAVRDRVFPYTCTKEKRLCPEVARLRPASMRRCEHIDPAVGPRFTKAVAPPSPIATSREVVHTKANPSECITSLVGTHVLDVTGANAPEKGNRICTFRVACKQRHVVTNIKISWYLKPRFEVGVEHVKNYSSTSGLDCNKIWRENVC